MNGFEPTSSYAIKASLTRDPIYFIIAGLFLAVGVFGLIVRNFEKTYNYGGRTHQFDYHINAPIVLRPPKWKNEKTLSLAFLFFLLSYNNELANVFEIDKKPIF